MHDYLHLSSRLAESASPAVCAVDTLGETPADELSDDQLEHVVGGLARVWVDDVTDALMSRHYHRAPSSTELIQ